MKKKTQCVSCDYKSDFEFKLQQVYRPKALGVDVTLVKAVSVAKCPSCGEEQVHIPNLNQLHEVIERILVSKLGVLTGAEIRFLRKRLGYDTKSFSKLIGNEPSTMSRIENGQQKVSTQLDRHVRFIVQARDPDRDYDLHDAILRDDMKEIRNLRIKQSRIGWAPA